LTLRRCIGAYLSKLHSVLGWCVRNDIIESNAATGVSVERVADNGDDDRKPFSPGDLAKIFAPPLFGSGAPVTAEIEERRWTLLLALFAGARASECARIKLDDIQTLRDVLTVTIEGETKNRASNRRIVPVHSTLIALGFETRVAKLRAAGAKHFFPEWYTAGNRTGRFGRFIPRWFNEHYKVKLGIADKLKVFHSLRHNFTTE
jgi:integrase